MTEKQTDFCRIRHRKNWDYLPAQESWTDPKSSGEMFPFPSPAAAHEGNRLSTTMPEVGAKSVLRLQRLACYLVVEQAFIGQGT